MKDGDTYTATITWSSSNYDKMTVDGVDYAPINDGGNSTFEIPVTLDEDIAVSAETVAMSTPHTIDYTIHFDSSTMKEKSGDEASGGSPAGNGFKRRGRLPQRRFGLRLEADGDASA